MKNKNQVHAAEPEVVVDFLGKTLPFNELDESAIRRLIQGCLIDFFPKGTLIFRQDETEVKYLYVIQKGGVKTYLKDEEGAVTLKDFRGEGEYFGALPMIQGTNLANLNVEAVEDSFLFLLDRDAFLELLKTSPKVTHYFLRSMSEKLVNTAYSELREHRLAPRTENALYLFSVRVGDIIKGEAKSIASGDSVQEAARRMASLHIGSLLVHDPEGRTIGIITDKDLRTKVVAAGLDFLTPVERIMTAPVRSIASHRVCFDAMLTMMRNSIHHLAVEQQGRITGVITAHDIMLLQGTSPLYLFREILSQQKIEGLYPLAAKVPLVVRTLIEEGAKANNITRMITILNDHILDRLLSLLIAELGPPPLPFCWLLMGSEGRREQTFKTDQDNALIYANPGGPDEAARAETYFAELAGQAIEHLVACGYPRCPGEIMASNPKWRQSFSVWQGYFDRWLRTPEPREVLHSTIFFDFRSGYGSTELAEGLRRQLTDKAPSSGLFLLHLAKDCLEARPPLSFFRNLIVEKDGEHKNLLDLKTKGLVPFVDFARLFALRAGVHESNTLGRLQLLAEGGHLPRDLCSESIEAYEFIMHLRLIHQLRLLEEKGEPNNYINPADLSDLEKQTLKESFAVVRRIQGHIKDEFRLDGV